MKTILYTRDNCHLCTAAAQLLAEHGLQPELVDIDSDSTLLAQFDTRVPVVEIDGKMVGELQSEGLAHLTKSMLTITTYVSDVHYDDLVIKAASNSDLVEEAN